jgi:hypothetical protein
MSRGGFSSCRKAMCKMCMEGMLNSLNTDIHDRHGNKLKRSRRHLIEKMTKPKTKHAIDFSMCNHDTKEGFQEEVISHTSRNRTEMDCKKLGRLILLLTRIA